MAADKNTLLQSSYTLLSYFQARQSSIIKQARPSASAIDSSVYAIRESDFRASILNPLLYLLAGAPQCYLYKQTSLNVYCAAVYSSYRT